jgi:alkylhydroperoxidase/carboxymuconolactone decarboxylase family protein YurZ
MMADYQERIPRTYKHFEESYPEIAALLAELGKSANNIGHIDSGNGRLIKLAFAIACRSEGAVQANVHKALHSGVSADAIRQVAVMAITSVGLPAAMAALQWIEKAIVDHK